MLQETRRELFFISISALLDEEAEVDEDSDYQRITVLSAISLRAIMMDLAKLILNLYRHRFEQTLKSGKPFHNSAKQEIVIPPIIFRLADLVLSTQILAEIFNILSLRLNRTSLHHHIQKNGMTYIFEHTISESSVQTPSKKRILKVSCIGK